MSFLPSSPDFYPPLSHFTSDSSHFHLSPIALYIFSDLWLASGSSPATLFLVLTASGPSPPCPPSFFYQLHALPQEACSPHYPHPLNLSFPPFFPLSGLPIVLQVLLLSSILCSLLHSPLKPALSVSSSFPISLLHFSSFLDPPLVSYHIICLRLCPHIQLLLRPADNRIFWITHSAFFSFCALMPPPKLLPCSSSSCPLLTFLSRSASSLSLHISPHIASP